MKIISYNVNGIRAAFTKDFLGWLNVANPDIICIQESKAGNDQIDMTVYKKMAISVTGILHRRKDILALESPLKSNPNKLNTDVELNITILKVGLYGQISMVFR